MAATIEDDRTSRRNALDHFAEQSAPTISQSNPGMVAMGADRVYGAQQVQVYRDDARILQKLKTLGAAAGDDWFYRFPVKSKDGSKSFIEGPSIKLANDLARIYGNCSVDVRVFDIGSSWMIYARFMDYETGFDMTRPFQQNKGASKIGGQGPEADARRLDIALQIGVSKAIRNVVTNALQTYADYAFEAAKDSLVDKIGKDVAKWQDQMAVRLKDRGVELQRVEYVIGRVLKDWTAPDIARVIAMMKAVADGMATIDETFPPKDQQTKHDPETGEISEGEVALAASSEENPPREDGAATDREAGKASAAQAGEASTTNAKTKSAESAADTPVSEAGTNAGGKASSGPATSTKTKAGGNNTGEKPPVDKSDKAESSTDQKGSDTAAPSGPTNEREYLTYAQAWIEALADADAGAKNWASEKTMRNKCNVSSETREALQERLAEKQREIRDADKS